MLACVVQGKAGTLQWTRDDFGLGTARELAGYNRYIYLQGYRVPQKNWDMFKCSYLKLGATFWGASKA